jgi:DNA-binding response OmpR family regulator
MSWAAKKKILLVESSEDHRYIFKISCLESTNNNVKVVEAVDHKEGIFKCRNQAFDIVILSANSNDKDAYTFLQSAGSQPKDTRPKMILLILSGKLNEAWKVAFPSLLVIKKPCSGDDIKKVIPHIINSISAKLVEL